ncbi:hypothetical protein E5163_11090 [Marinicauda algicola]|uniref:Peptidase A2 domain-containing protein n=1 Tax=Marinicauda algicola TaxID=2029849 RepID=A0A4S2GZD8_9PROT|nr:retroviral-like aspartic protease family protein [Marinicauda algicola]TGY88358.1 hypothetical protein E5163_11090 [Marinicauda algicola]
MKLLHLIAAGCVLCSAASTASHAGTTSAAVGDGAAIVFDAEGRPAITVRLNDTAEFMFAIDTAAQSTAIGARVIDALALQPDPEHQARLHGASGVRTVPMYLLESIEAGGQRLEDRLVVSLTGEHDQGGHAHDGILGQDVFARGRLSFDFEAMTIGFDGAGARPLAGHLPAEILHGGFFLVQIEIDGVATTAVIDTGAAESFANRTLMEALASENEALSTRREAAGVSQHEMDFRDGYTATLRIGTARLEAVPVAFAEAPIFGAFGLAERPAIILGMNLLSRLPRFALDYDSSHFLFDPA